MAGSCHGRHGLDWFLLKMGKMKTEHRQACRDAFRVLDNLATAVLLADADLRIRYLNPAAELLLERSLEQVSGTRLVQVLRDGSGFVDRLQQAVAGNQPFMEREVALLLPSGRDATVDCTLTPLAEADGQAEVLLEMVQVDRQLRIVKEENLMGQNQALRQLVRGVAHEVKNPLGGLRGAAQLLERELPTEELREYTRIIIGEADRLQQLVDRMLGPNNLPRRRRCNIHELLERVRGLVAAENPEGLVIERDYDPSIPDFVADGDMLVQALLNIVRNAAQALEGKGLILLRTRILRQFTIGRRRHRLVLQVDVEDNGPGVPPEMEQTLFYPMVTGRADGTGLGLAIAQSLINRHGGLIEYSSRTGHTLFSILLPMEFEEDEGS